MHIKSIFLSASLLAGASAGDVSGLTVAGAIRRAWTDQAGLRGGEAMVEARRAEAEAAAGLRLPTLTLSAQGLRTDEPMAAFGIRLNQARITPSDFDPAALNRPDAIGAYGGSAVLRQPLYAGGRLAAARRAGEHLLQAEEASQARRRQETARQVVEAYFGIQVAEQALAWAEDARAWIAGLESFTAARVAQGLLLESELQRLKAAHAQADAQRAEALGQVRAVRSGLGLLLGAGPVEGPLATPLEAPGLEPGADPGPAPGVGPRGDLLAADLQVRAAQEGARAAAGARRPEVGLEVGAGTLYHGGSEKGSWSWAAVGVSWKVFSAPDLARVRAARAQERAAEDARTFRRQQAEHEVRLAKEALATAEARRAAAAASLAAAEASRRLREARHREGLMPLVEVLDADAAVQGARSLLLRSLYDLRVGRAALDLATGNPIEGVNP